MPTVAPPRQRGDEPNLRIRPTGHETPNGDLSGDRSHEAKAIETVRLRYKGVEVHVSGLPNSRKVSDNQKAKAAKLFGADPKSMSMSTLLWNAKETAVKE